MQTKLTEEGGGKGGVQNLSASIITNQYPAVRPDCARVDIKKRLLTGSISLRDAYFCQRVG